MNPYEILRIPNSASLEQIKAAFRKRAKETHPDTNPDNPNAAEEFNKVVEAYNILSDPSSRKELDSMIQAGSYSENYTAEDFYHSEGFNYYSATELERVINELRSQAAAAKAEAAKFSLQGAAWFIGGLIVTAITLVRGSGLLTWGAIIFGGYEAIKGFKAYLDINSELEKQEKQIWEEYMNRGGTPNADSYTANVSVGTTNAADMNTNRTAANANETSADDVSKEKKKPVKEKKKLNKKKLGITAGIIGIALIIVVTVISLSNRPLLVKDGSYSGTSLYMYTGEEQELEYDGRGIDKDDYQNVVIEMADDESADVISIDGNTVKALKPGTAKLNAVLKKGISTYKNTISIDVLTRSIEFNEDSTIKMYEGDEHEIDIDLESIPKDMAKSIEWTEEYDKKIVKIKGNKITALRTGSTTIKAYLDDNGDVYEGLLFVDVEAKPVDFTNGEIVKGSSGDAPVKVKAPTSDDVYVFLKGKSEGTEDFAFLVKRGEEAEVKAPVGTYLLHVGYGTTWYGKNSLFGEDASYFSSTEETKFYEDGSYVYGVELDLSDKPTGNYSNYDSFPR